MSRLILQRVVSKATWEVRRATAFAESDTKHCSCSTGTHSSGHGIPKAIKYMTTISGQKQISQEKSSYAHCRPKGLPLRVLSVIIYSTAKTTQAPSGSHSIKTRFPFDKEKEQTKGLMMSPT